MTPSSPSYDRRRERLLLERYHRDGDLAAREELVERLLPLARDLARRHAQSGESLDDLVQVASLGLLKAIDRYDLDRGPGLVSYAAPTIAGELKRHFRDKGWALHVPRDLQEQALVVTRQREGLSARLGRSPTVRELAADLGWSTERVIEAAGAADQYSIASLDAPLTSGEAGSAAALDMVGQPDEHLGLVDDRDAITRSWRELSDVERRVIRLRLVEDMTQREIGVRVGYSQMHVSRLLRHAIRRLAA
jgi:RNA polymerase sigma-B factor